MARVILSYSAIDILHRYSHGWINKTLGIQSADTPATLAGKATHILIQNHVSGVKKDPRFDFPMNFPTVEYHATKSWNEAFSFHGYVDGINFASKSFLEIKSSGHKLWSQADFDRSIQPAYYGWVTGFRKAYLAACNFGGENMRIYSRVFTEADITKAKKWALEGIAIIERGDFTGGLDEHGKCMGCSYGQNCYFI